MDSIKVEIPPLDEDQPEDIKLFLSFLVSVISDDLNSMNSVAAGVTLSWTLAQYKADQLDPLIPLMMRTLSKLVKDHITLATQNRQAESSGQSDYEAKMTCKLLEKILNFSAMRISALGDQRRIFLSLLVQLIDRSNDKHLLMKIVEIARGWVFTRNELFPTIKEKAGILSKMMVFEMKGDAELSKAFYQIIVDVCKDDQLAYTELTVRIEHAFLVGTKVSNVEVRQNLMQILDSSLEKDIVKRLFYLVREQNWEYLAEYPWLNQASQLLYGSFDTGFDLKLGPKEYKLAPLSNISEAIPSKLLDQHKEPSKPISDFTIARYFISKS
ncbi:unnamed protein product [Ambrosiozyma monospora]|uniref:Unnamed protein product n=1 Tax=Ambrosiozyma monospora TaxID=43982 RepID=A0ACB5T6F2_AMBMO|nr:unnamed protein product [Ambrosiozyma monospora]